ncbi:MAG: triose-phosphate isomerase [Oscillospiraceae bacterium]
MRKKLIAGNWKMNGSRSDILSFFESIPPNFSAANCETVLCLPYVYLDYASPLFKNSQIKLGAQNCHAQEQGAHTGEISAYMLKDVGAEFVIIGHSERRKEFAEDSVAINQKLKAVLKNHIKPILCVGEQEYEYSRKMGKSVVEIQLKVGLSSLLKEQMQDVLIAYEPVWAVGAESCASNDYILDMATCIRKTITELYNAETANKVRILYGGSVNSKSVKQLLNLQELDGFLIGRASQNASSFFDIVEQIPLVCSRSSLFSTRNNGLWNYREQ